jgi:hypothetical protein
LKKKKPDAIRKWKNIKQTRWKWQGRGERGIRRVLTWSFRYTGKAQRNFTPRDKHWRRRQEKEEKREEAKGAKGQRVGPARSWDHLGEEKAEGRVLAGVWAKDLVCPGIQALEIFGHRDTCRQASDSLGLLNCTL